jgi:signal transduction histidine kinase
MRERIFAIGGEVVIANRARGAEVRIRAPRVALDPSTTLSTTLTP